MFHSPGELHRLDKHKAIKRLPAAPAATVYSGGGRNNQRGASSTKQGKLLSAQWAPGKLRWKQEVWVRALGAKEERVLFITFLKFEPGEPLGR